MKTLVFEKELDKDYGGIKYHHLFGGYPTLHNHDYFEFFLVTGGSYTHVFADGKVNLEKHQCILIRPEDAHQIIASSDQSAHINVSVSAAKFKSFADSIGEEVYESLTREGKRVFSIFEVRLTKISSYLNYIRQKDSVGERTDVLISMLLFNLFETMMNQSSLSVPRVKSQVVNQLLIDIGNPQNVSWSVDDAVKHSGYSHSHLSRLFKQETGISLMDYLVNMKMALARDMLVNTDVPLKELCALLGYSSLSHFNCIFKKYYSVSLGKYRALNKKETI